MANHVLNISKIAFPRGFSLSKTARLNTGEFLPYVGDKIKPYFRNPVIIPQATFDYLAEDILKKLPQYRFVFLTMKEYRLAARRDQEYESHLIMFCLRPIGDNNYQPLGVFTADVMMGLDEQLAIIWRAFIEDLSILGITVLASMSSTSPIFHGALEILTENDNALTQYAPIIYSIHPFPKILHLFDFDGLLDMFEDTLRRCDRIHFLARVLKGDPEDPLGKLNYYETSYQEIKRYQSQFDDTNMSIFDHRLEKLIAEEHIRKSKRLFKSDSIMLLFSDIHWIGKMRKIDVQWSPERIERLYECFESFRIILATARFTIHRNATPFELEALPNIGSLSYRKPLGYNIPGSNGGKLFFHTKQPKNIFECFLQAVLYDDRECYLKRIAETCDEYSIETVRSFRDDSESDSNISSAAVEQDKLPDTVGLTSASEDPQITVAVKEKEKFEEIQTSEAATEPVVETIGSNIFDESIMKFAPWNLSENVTFETIKNFIVDQIMSGNIMEPLTIAPEDITSLQEAVHLVKKLLTNMTRILMYYDTELSICYKNTQLAEIKNSVLNVMSEVKDKKKASVISDCKENREVDFQENSCTDASGTDDAKKSIEDFTSDLSCEEIASLDEFVRLEDLISGHITAEVTLSYLETLRQKSETCKKVVKFFLPFIQKLSYILATPSELERLLLDNETTYHSSLVWVHIVHILQEVELDDKLDNRPNQIEENTHIVNAHANPQFIPPKYSKSNKAAPCGKNIATIGENNYDNPYDEMKIFNEEDDDSSVKFISDDLIAIAEAIISEIEESNSRVSDVSTYSNTMSTPELEDDSYEIWGFATNMIHQHDVYVSPDNQWKNDDYFLDCKSEADTLEYPERKTVEKPKQVDDDLLMESECTQPRESVKSTDDKMTGTDGPKSKADGNLVVMEQDSKPDSAQDGPMSDRLILIEQSDKLKRLKNVISQQIADDVRLKSLKLDQNTANQLTEVLSKVTSIIDSNDQELIDYAESSFGLPKVKTSEHPVNPDHSIKTKKTSFEPNQLDIKIQLEDIKKPKKNLKSISTSVTESSKEKIKISSDLIRVGNIIIEKIKPKEDSNLPCKEAHITLEKLEHFLSKLFTEDGNVKPLETFKKRTVICRVIMNYLAPFSPGIYAEKKDSDSENNKQNLPNEHLALLPTEHNIDKNAKRKKRKKAKKTTESDGKNGANFNSAFESKPMSDGNVSKELNDEEEILKQPGKDEANPNADNFTSQSSTNSESNIFSATDLQKANASVDFGALWTIEDEDKQQNLSEQLQNLSIIRASPWHNVDTLVELKEGQTSFQVDNNSVNHVKEPELTTKYSDADDAHKNSNAAAEESAFAHSDTEDIAAPHKEPDGNMSKELHDEDETTKPPEENKEDPNVNKVTSEGPANSKKDIFSEASLKEAITDAFGSLEGPTAVESAENVDEHQNLIERLQHLALRSTSPLREIDSETLSELIESETLLQVDANAVNNQSGELEVTTEYSDAHKKSNAAVEESARPHSDTEDIADIPKKSDGRTRKQLKEDKANLNEHKFTSEDPTNSENVISSVTNNKEATANASGVSKGTSGVVGTEDDNRHQTMSDQLHNMLISSTSAMFEVDPATLSELIEDQALFQVDDNSLNTESKDPEITTIYSDTDDDHKNSSATAKESALVHSDTVVISALSKESEADMSKNFNDEKATKKQPEIHKEDPNVDKFTSEGPANSENDIFSAANVKEATTNASGSLEGPTTVENVENVNDHQNLIESLHTSELMKGQTPFQVNDNAANNQSGELEVTTEYSDAHKKSNAAAEESALPHSDTVDIAALPKESDGNMRKELNDEEETLKQPEDETEDPSTDTLTCEGTANSENAISIVTNLNVQLLTKGLSIVASAEEDEMHQKLSEQLHNMPIITTSPLLKLDSTTLSEFIESETPSQVDENSTDNISKELIDTTQQDGHKQSDVANEELSRNGKNLQQTSQDLAIGKNAISMLIKAEDISNAVLKSQQKRASLRDLINNIYGGVRAPSVSTEPHHKEEDDSGQKSPNLSGGHISLKATKSTAVTEPFVDKTKSNDGEMSKVHQNDLIQHHVDYNSENNQFRQPEDAVGHNTNVNLVSSDLTPKAQTVKDPDHEELTLDNEHSRANIIKLLELSDDQDGEKQPINAEDSTIINTNRLLIESESPQGRGKMGENSENLKSMNQDVETQSAITENNAGLNGLMVKKHEEECTFRNYEPIMQLVETFTANIGSGNSSITRLKKLINKVTSVLDSSNQQLYTLSKASGSEPSENSEFISYIEDRREEAELPSAKAEGASNLSSQDDLSKLDDFISKLFQSTSNSAKDLRHKTELCKMIIDSLIAILQKRSNPENVSKPKTDYSESLPDLSISEMSVPLEDETFAPSLIENDSPNVASDQNELNDSGSQELTKTTECNRNIDALEICDLKDKQLKHMLAEDTNSDASLTKALEETLEGDGKKPHTDSDLDGNTSEQQFQFVATPENFSSIPTDDKAEPHAATKSTAKIRELKKTITNAIDAIQNTSNSESAQRKQDSMGLSKLAIIDCNLKLNTTKSYRFVSGVLTEQKAAGKEAEVTAESSNDVHMREENVNQTGPEEEEEESNAVATKSAEVSQQTEAEKKHLVNHLTKVLKDFPPVSIEHQTESDHESGYIQRELTLEELGNLERNAQKRRNISRSDNRCMLSNINDLQPLKDGVSTSEKDEHQRRLRKRRSLFKEKCTWFVNSCLTSEVPPFESIRTANNDDDDDDESMSESTVTYSDKMMIFAMRAASAMSEPFIPVSLQKDDVFKDSLNFFFVNSRIPLKTYGQLISSLWLSTLKGYKLLTEILNSHFVELLPARLLFIDHIDHFVFSHLKHQIDQNELKPGNGVKYVCADLPAALNLLKNHVHKIKQNATCKAEPQDTNWYSFSESKNRKL